MSGPITKDASTWVLGLMQIRVGAASSNISTITSLLTSTHSLGAMANTKYLGNAEYFKQESGFPLTEDGVIPLRESFALEAGFKEITPYNLALARGIDPTDSVVASVVEDVSIVTTSGTTSTDLIATGAGTIDEEWTVFFLTATTGVIIGKDTGHVHDFANLTSAMAPEDGDTDAYFTIPASFFTGTWAADETYVFHTHAGGASTYSSAHSGTIGLGGLTSPADVRVEAVYTFPNGTNTMTFILPRAQVVANMEMDFATEDAAAVPVTFEAKNASSNNSSGNAAWDAMPLGQIIFG